MPSAVRYHANRKHEGRVSSGKAILNEEFVSLPGGNQAIVNLVEGLFGHRLIDGTPVDGSFGTRLAHYIFVLGRTTGELTRSHRQRPDVGEQSFMTLQRFLHQLGGSQIPVRNFYVSDAVLAQLVTTRTNAYVLHGI